MLPAILLLLSASLLVWTAAAVRWTKRSPLVRWSRRRPVAWSGWEVLLIAAIYLCLEIVLQGSLSGWLTGVFSERVDSIAGVDETAGMSDHPITQLLHSSAGGWVWLLCGVSAVLVAPLIEEFLFRVLFQGWLEKTEPELRSNAFFVSRLPRGVFPILLSALPFAMLHWRSGDTRPEPAELLALLTINTIANTATLAVGIVLLRVQAAATWRDLGFDFRRMQRDLGISVLGLAAVLGPAYAIQLGLQFAKDSGVWPQQIATDPIPLFLLALALGYIYHRTHRILPIFVLHALFNGFALVSLWLTA